MRKFLLLGALVVGCASVPDSVDVIAIDTTEDASVASSDKDAGAPEQVADAAK